MEGFAPALSRSRYFTAPPSDQEGLKFPFVLYACAEVYGDLGHCIHIIFKKTRNGNDLPRNVATNLEAHDCLECLYML